MISDINKLVLGYLIESNYEFPDWVKQLIENQEQFDNLVKTIAYNPRAISHIKKLKDKTNMPNILRNPHKKAFDIIQEAYTTHKKDRYKVSHNKTSEPKMVQWINKKTGKSYLNKIKELGNDSISHVIEQELAKFAPSDHVGRRYKRISLIYDIIKTFGDIPSEYNQYIINEINNDISDPVNKIARYKVKELFSSIKNKHIIELLKDVNIPNWLFPSINTNPYTLDILNAYPDKISSRIYRNSNPIIIKILEAKFNKNSFVPDETNVNIYNWIMSHNIHFDYLMFNPQASKIVECSMIEIFDVKIETDVYTIKLPDDLPDKLMVSIENKILRDKHIPGLIIKNGSHKLIELYKKYSQYVSSEDILVIASYNPYILSELVHPHRLISRINKYNLLN